MSDLSECQSFSSSSRVGPKAASPRRISEMSPTAAPSHSTSHAPATIQAALARSGLSQNCTTTASDRIVMATTVNPSKASANVKTSLSRLFSSCHSIRAS